jgi:hypothetical protein
MSGKNQLTFWTDAKRSRYFLIPDNQKLSRGRFIISTLTGTQKKVTQSAIANFEISESEAKVYLQTEMNQAMAQAKTAFSNFMSFSTQTSEKAPSNPTPSSNQADIISSLLGVSLEELQNNPEVAQTAFVNIYTDLKEFLSESTSENSPKVEAARSRLGSLRETLQAQGINISEEIEELPDKLQEVLSWANLEGYLEEIVTKLRDLTEQLEQSPDAVGEKIDQTIKSLSKDLFIDEEKQLEEKRKQNYKDSAENAIAQSLKSRGFTSFAGGNFNF